MGLLRGIVASFSSGVSGIGLPLGNLTSQLFVNIYLHELDFYIKHELHARHYIRYADDFVIICSSQEKCLEILSAISAFLNNKLALKLHPNKVQIKTFSSGVDFLGWVHFYDHHVLRKTTVGRIKKKMLLEEVSEQARVSYRGLLSHGNTWKLKVDLGL